MSASKATSPVAVAVGDIEDSNVKEKKRLKVKTGEDISLRYLTRFANDTSDVK